MSHATTYRIEEVPSVSSKRLQQCYLKRVIASQYFLVIDKIRCCSCGLHRRNKIVSTTYPIKRYWQASCYKSRNSRYIIVTPCYVNANRFKVKYYISVSILHKWLEHITTCISIYHAASLRSLYRYRSATYTATFNGARQNRLGKSLMFKVL